MYQPVLGPRTPNSPSATMFLKDLPDVNRHRPTTKLTSLLRFNRVGFLGRCKHKSEDLYVNFFEAIPVRFSKMLRIMRIVFFS